MKKYIGKILPRMFGVMYFVFFFCMLATIPVYAYIDPATTAMLTQIIAGLFISAGVAFGVFRRKIALFFKNMSVKRAKRKIEKQKGKPISGK